jgi:putative protease
MILLPELLAPAANVECAVAAFDHGADAIYIGVGPYNLRGRSRSASVEDLAHTLAIASEKGRRVYVALNTMPNDDAIPGIRALLESFAQRSCLPHAFIVSDPGVVSLCRARLPGVALHLSTQTGTFNRESVEFWAGSGIARIVVPRELSLVQIERLCAVRHVEMEAFVHGAMCMSISGRCLLGVYTGRRHPNQGDCPQPCRTLYRVSPLHDNRTETGEWYDVEESGQEGGAVERAFLFNSKDLCCLDILDKLVSTGLSSLKIEGRNRSLHYVSSVVKVYRAALDSLVSGEPYTVSPEWREELDRLDHRPYTTGFYAGEYALQDTAANRPLPQTRVVGVVRELASGRGALVDVKNPFDKGDVLNVLPLNAKKCPMKWLCKQ